MTVRNKRGEKIEFVKCNLCGSDDTENYIFFDGYKYVVCRRCGLIYQNFRPVFGDLKSRYSKKYFKYEYRNKDNFFNLMKLTLKDVGFDKITKSFPKSKKFLDIGSAVGLLLNYAKQKGWDAVGVEICKESADYAKNKFNVEVYNKTLEKAKFKSNTFNVVHMSHVIEHVPSPSDTLNEIYRILKPGGYLIITTPRVDSLQAKLFKETWRSYHRDHIYIFSKKTLKGLLEKNKFKIKKFVTWGGIEEGRVNLLVKTVADKFVKRFGYGDVMCFLAQK